MKRTKNGGFRQAFNAEWALYQSAHKAGEKLDVPMVRDEAQFDDHVAVGDIRLFADTNPPRSGLVFRSWDTSAWYVIPVSVFSSPASDHEALVGNRVYQLWNATPVSVKDIVRSWVSERIDSDDLEKIGLLLESVQSGRRVPKELKGCLGEPISGLLDPRRDYEMEFLLSDESFERRQPDIIIPDWGFGNVSVALAAASRDVDQQSNIVYREVDANSRDGYPSKGCVLDRPFVSISPKRDPGTLAFSWEGTLPPDWNLDGEVRVTAHERLSRMQIGEGHLDLLAGEVVIDKFGSLDSLEHPIKNASDIVIVLSVPKKVSR